MTASVSEARYTRDWARAGDAVLLWDKQVAVFDSVGACDACLNGAATERGSDFRVDGNHDYDNHDDRYSLGMEALAVARQLASSLGQNTNKMLQDMCVERRLSRGGTKAALVM